MQAELATCRAGSAWALHCSAAQAVGNQACCRAATSSLTARRRHVSHVCRAAGKFSCGRCHVSHVCGAMFPMCECRAAWRTGMRSRRRRRQRTRPTRRRRWGRRERGQCRCGPGCSSMRAVRSCWAHHHRSSGRARHSIRVKPRRSLLFGAAGGGANQEAAHRSAGEHGPNAACAA